jgi:hypothetical protein
MCPSRGNRVAWADGYDGFIREVCVTATPWEPIYLSGGTRTTGGSSPDVLTAPNVGGFIISIADEGALDFLVAFERS